jgi:signal transduction histidine kinase
MLVAAGVWAWNAVVGATPVLMVQTLDPAVLRDAWLRLMTVPAVAAAGMTLLLALTGRAQRRARRDHDALLLRAEAAEAGLALAQARAELESRLRRTEKLAAIGQLTAGVAHDFNNVLQSVIASAESLTEPGLPADEIRSIAELILRVGERGMVLTRHMTDFARRNDPPGEDTDIAASLGELDTLLARAFGPRHRLRIEAAGIAGLRAHGPPAVFEAMLINLAANARDAMPNGGDIVIAAAEVMAVPAAPGTLPGKAAGTPTGLAPTPLATSSAAPITVPAAATGRTTAGALKPGRYVRVTVTDTGRGMDAATLSQADEAFFTTGPPGTGTGLGLVMVRGTAVRAGGRLDLASVAGGGTVVTLWLPALA